MSNSTLINNFKSYLVAVKYLQLSTVTNYCYEINIFLEYKRNLCTETDFESIVFSSYLKYRESNKVKTIGTINNYIKAIKSFYDFLYEEQIINYNYGSKLEINRTKYKIPDVLDCFDIHCIFEQFNTTTETSLRNAAIIENLYSTGCRVSELINMNIEVIERTNNTVIGKNNNERFIIFNQKSKNRIKSYLSIRKNKSNILFTNLNGKKLSAKYINKMIHEVCIKAQVRFKVTAHTFRHTFASHLYEGGSNIIELKNLLGHKDVTTTEIYTHYVGVDLLRKELQLHHPRW